MSKISRRKVIAGGAAAAATATAGLLGFHVLSKRKPVKNVLFIVSDALRADRLGCYGYRDSGGKSLTPNIDALAAGGVLYERCLTPSSWTMQSVAAYMSSRPPFVAGDLYNEGFAPKAAPTLAETLRAQGYNTAAIVKNPWLWIKTPDESREIVAARGFDVYRTGYMIHVENPLFEQGIGEEQVYERFTDAASAVRQSIMLMPELTAGGKPFFLYLHFMDTHEPYNPPDEFKAACAVPQVEGIPDYMLHQAMREYAKRRGEERLSETDMPLLARAQGLYDTCVRFVDSEVGRLIDYLKMKKLFDDTLIVFSSDHGEEFGEHGWIGHSTTLYEESLKAPLIVAGPDVGEGLRIAEQATSLAIAPTILRSCGVAVPRTMFGRPLDVSGTSAGVPPKVVASLVRPDGPDPLYEKMYMMCDARGPKLIRHEYQGERAGEAAREELYDISKDPGEKTDLAVENASVVAALGSHLELLREAHKGVAGEGLELDAETLRQLKAIGYIGK